MRAFFYLLLYIPWPVAQRGNKILPIKIFPCGENIGKAPLLAIIFNIP
jgi:hypothetical protein